MSGKLSEEHMDQLESWIDTGPKMFTLLYSITRDGCVGTTFHSKCDNQGPTVTMLYNPQGSVYGGYTSASWKSDDNYSHDDKAFLFQLLLSGNNKRNKFPSVQPEYAIYNHPSYGPTFGDDHDLLTFVETANVSYGVFALNGHLKNRCFHQSYNKLSVKAADINNGTMNVIELEVYKVTDGQRQKQITSVQPQLSPEPWRKVPEVNKKYVEQLKEEIENFKPMTDVGISAFRILMLGPVGSGKSSFYNTIDSIFRGRISHRAVSGNGQRTTTTKFTPYNIRTRSGTTLKFQLCDTPGFLETHGQDVIDYNFALDGCLPDFYEFFPGKCLSVHNPEFISKPSLSKRTHCVVVVVDGASVDSMSKQMVDKVQLLKKMVNQKDIPVGLLVTKIDTVDTTLTNKPGEVFTNEKVFKVVEKVSSTFGVPRNSVYPVKNYEHEVHLDDKVSALALMALQQLLYLTEDYTENLAASGATSRTSCCKQEVSDLEVTASDTA